MIISWFGFLILGLVLLGGISSVARIGKSGTGAVGRILAVCGACLLAFVIAVLMLVGTKHPVSSVGESNWSGPFDVEENSLPSSVAVASAAADTTVVQTTTTADGEMLVLPLSDGVLVKLIGEEGVRAIEHLNQSVSPELRQAYAMIPISGPGSVLPGSIGPSVIPTAVRDQGLSFLKSAVSEFLASGMSTRVGEVPTASVPAAEAPLAAEAESEDFVPPAWIKTPGEGYIVVNSDFIDPTISAVDALKPEIINALNKHIADLVSSKLGARDGLQNLVEISVTDSAIQDCIVKTSAHTMVLESTTGQPTMRQTFGLITFPKSLDEKLIQQVRSSLQYNRVVTLCITAGILWLSTFFLSLAFRAGQSQSILRKLATVPMIAILIVPCVVMFIAMSGAMLRGETFDLSWSKDRVVCVIDKLVE